AVAERAPPRPTAATRQTCHADGPTAARRPLPSGPPAKAAITPSAPPVSAPQANPHMGAVSSATTGAARTVSSPPKAPARYGTASTAADSKGGTAECTPCGSAASKGNAGIWPSAEPGGATTAPAPNANPGPSVNEMAQAMAFGA